MSVSGLTHALSYCCTLSIFFLGFHQWQSRDDKFLILKMTSTILEHLESGQEPGPPGLGHMCGPSARAVIIAIVELRSESA